MSVWPIAVHDLAGSACGVALWRQAGELRATVVVKGTFRMLHAGAMEPIEPRAVLGSDEHHGDSPAKSLKRARELAPYRQHCDVTLHGHAHAPAGQAVPAASARLAVFRDDRALVDRTVHVFGDRPLGPGGAPGAPEPFTSMPLDYERALRSDGNPGGVNPAKKAPNLMDVEQPEAVAGGFGPISPYAKLRRELLAGVDRRALEADIAELPDRFDWQYFQSALPAQRCDPLTGTEWVILDGLNAVQSRLSSQLPQLRAEACVVALSAEGAATIAADLPLRLVPIALVADGLHIDADAAQVTVTWRGSFALSSERHVDQLVVTGGWTRGSEPLRWPTPEQLAASGQIVIVPDDGADKPTFDGTHSIELGGSTQRSERLPFDDALAAVDVSIKPTPQIIGEGTVTYADSSGSTMTLSPSQRGQLAMGTLPFAKAPGEQPPPAEAEPAGTRALDPGEVAQALEQAKAPFELAGPGEGRPAAAPPEAPYAPPPDDDGTQEVSPAALEAARRQAAPYRLAEAGSEAEVVAPDGAPYAAAEAKPVPQPIGGETLDLGPQESVAASRFFHQPQPRDEAPAEPDPSVEPLLPSRTTEGIPVVNHTFMHVVYTSWQHRPPRDSLTFVVKGSFELKPGQAASPCEESELPLGDQHHDDDLERSLGYPSDFAHFKPRADVVVLGSAYAPRDPQGEHRGVASEARLRLGRDGNAIDRHVAVFGDRHWTKALLALGQSELQPFEKIPMIYERAFGGSGFEDNPVGLGHRGAAGEDGVARLPNLEDPAQLIKAPGDKPKPACFGPLSPLWLQRRSRMGRYDGRWLRKRWPYFPDDFDWTHFQCAPRSQQLEHLTGDEPFCISGMHPEHSHLEGTLAGVTPQLFMAMKGDDAGAPGAELAFEKVVLALDTVVFDMEASRVHQVWRGVVEVSDEHAPEIQALYLLVDPPGQITEATDAYARFLVAAQPQEPIEEDPDAETEPANDVEPVADMADGAEDDADMDALIEEQQQALRDQLASLGIAPEEASEVPKPPPPDPQAIAETMRRGGMPEDEIATVLAAMAEAQAAGAEDEGEPEPEPPPLREQVMALLAAGEPLDELDLAGVDLSRLDLSGRSFVGCDLSEADLSGSHFIEAQLQGAELGGADLRGARLDRADLTGADLTAAELGGCVLDGAELSEVSGNQAKADGASFRAVTGAGLDLTDSSLVGARFDGARLQRPVLAEATFDEAVFDGAELPHAQLFDASGKNASFRETNLENALCDGVVLTGANLSKVRANGSVWEGANLDDTVWLEAQLDQASFVRASIERADLSACEMRDVRMKRARACYARFVKSNLHQAQLERSDLQCADFTGANLYACETWKANLDQARFDQAIVAMSKLEGKA